MPSSQRRIWHEYPDVDLLYQHAVEAIERIAAVAIAKQGVFSIVLAGGSTPRAIYQRLCRIQTNWHAWHVYFGDERCLPEDDPERNSVMADQAWLLHVPILAAQIHRIPAQLGAEAAALHYQEALARVEIFDLVLLGLGQDGHTASLFPGQEWGGNNTHPSVLAVHHAPKPPSDRVSLSAWRLGRARHAWFLVTGQDKAEAIRLWRAQEEIPAASISPDSGVDIWMTGL